MAGAPDLLLAFAVIILVGYFAHLIARRSSFPDLLVLILLGFFAGPLNRELLHFGPLTQVVNLVPLEVVTPIFSALALAIIMFDAGLGLRPDELAEGLRRSLLHTLLVFVLTVAGISAVTHVLLGWPLIVGALLGAALGGISTVVVVSVAERLAVSEEARTMLMMEGLLVDVLSISVATGLILWIQAGDASGADILLRSGGSMLLGAGVGFGAGLALAMALPVFRGTVNLYVLALGVLLAVYGSLEMLGGSGPIGALTLGLLVGNGRRLLGKWDLATDLSEDIGEVHDQISFLIRTFFFVLLGLQFDPTIWYEAGDLARRFTALAIDIPGVVVLAVAVAGLYLAIVGARAVVAVVSAPEASDRFPVCVVTGRGLGSAVLASLPFTVPAFLDGSSVYAQTMGPYEGMFTTLTSTLVMLTVLTTTIGVAIASRGSTSPSTEPGGSTPDP